MSRATQVLLLSGSNFGYATLMLYGGPFHALPLSSPNPLSSPITPNMPKHLRFGLYSVSLATTPEITFVFSSYRY